MGVVNTNGRLSLLRVHDRGTKFGPSSDQIDVEVVVAFQGRPNDFFGFQLRQDANAPRRPAVILGVIPSVERGMTGVKSGRPKAAAPKDQYRSRS